LICLPSNFGGGHDVAEGHGSVHEHANQLDEEHQSKEEQEEETNGL